MNTIVIFFFFFFKIVVILSSARSCQSDFVKVASKTLADCHERNSPQMATKPKANKQTNKTFLITSLLATVLHRDLFKIDVVPD